LVAPGPAEALEVIVTTRTAVWPTTSLLVVTAFVLLGLAATDVRAQCTGCPNSSFARAGRFQAMGMTNTATAAIADGDWNGDGVPDLAIAGASTLNLFVGDGKLGFGTPTVLSLPSGAFPSGIAVADFDLDSDLDLATANRLTSNVSIFLNLGGTFTGPTNVAVGYSPMGVVAGDFNRDGVPDLLTARSGWLTFLAGLGDGSFGGPTELPAVFAISDLASADIDGDGLLDVAVSRDTSPGNIVWYRGRGDGTFDPGVATTASGGYPEAIALGDLNGDGRPDIAALNTAAQTVSLLLFSAGTFGSETVVPVDRDSRTITIGRLNADTAGDVVVTSWAESAVSVLLGDGVGGVSSTVRVRGFYSPSGAHVADLDLNGVQDLAVSNNYDAGLHVYPGDGLGGFGPKQLALASWNRSIATGDFDDDGWPDLVAVDDHTSDLWFLRGLGDGTFATEARFPTGLSSPGSLGVGDFDGDAKLDLMVASPSVSSVAFLRGDGNGAFDAPVVHGIANRVDTLRGLRTGDFDKDGNLDFVTKNGLSDRAYVVYGDGTGGIAFQTSMAAGNSPADVAVLDFNKDGVLDLAVSDSLGYTVTRRQGSGNRTTPFTSPGTLAMASRPQGIVAGDFDEDGYVDLLVAGYTSPPGTVGLFRGTASTPFFETTPTDYSLGAGGNIKAGSVAAADVNGDGWLDALVVSPGDTSESRASVRVLAGTGSSVAGAAFLSPDVWMVAQRDPSVIAVADFNQDGRPDLATGEAALAKENGISILLNTNCTPRRLRTATHPSLCNTASTPFPTQPVVRVEDDGGNAFLCDADSVTASIVSGTGTTGASLLGQTALPTTAGIADWSTASPPLEIDLAGTKYRLQFTHPEAGLTFSRTFSLPAALAVSGPASYCQADPGFFSTDPGFDWYRWTVDPPSTPASFLSELTIGASTLLAGAHSVQVDASADTCARSASQPFTVVDGLSAVGIDPGDPVSICTTCPGPTLALTETGGGSVSHAWGYRTVPGGTITYLTGETDTSYTIDGSHFPGQGTYFVVEETTPQCGFATASNEVEVQVATATASDELEVFTVTSTDQTNRLEWALPAGRTTVRIRYREDPSWTDCTPPEDAGAGFLISPDPVFSAGGLGVYEHTGLTNGMTYCYSLFIEIGTAPSVFSSSPRSARGRPFATTGPVKWSFSTGAASLAAPGLGLGVVHVVSNDEILHAMVKGSGPTGGQWPAGWRPFTATGPSQSRPTTVSITVGPAQRVIYLGSQAATGNNAVAVDADTGLGLWGQPLGTPVQAGPAAIFDAYYDGSLDYILLGTRNSSGASAFYALDAETGASAAPWPYVGETSPFLDEIGIVSAQAAVDYPNERVFFTSYRLVPGTSDSVWCVDLATATRCSGWAAGVSAGLGDVAASPTLRGGRLYVAPISGVDSEIHALDADDGTALWSLPFQPADGQVKLFIVPDVFGDDLYFSTTTTVWAVTDNGTSGGLKWQRSISGPSQPVFFAGTGRVYVGGDDGKLYILDASDGTDAVPPVTLGDGLSAVGAPTVDQAGGFVYAGTDAGVVHAIAIP
jgi:hypothetical protein